jgi:hypothetical protein
MDICLVELRRYHLGSSANAGLVQPAGTELTITADLDAAVNREIGHLPETARQPYRTAEGLAIDREIADTAHSRSATASI